MKTDSVRLQTTNIRNLSRRSFLKTSAGVASLGAAALSPGLRPARAAAGPLSPPNETIRQAREAALGILKPSQKDLEHGLELHANSLVFESYGFAPRAAPDGDRIRRAMEEGASETELSDLREESPMIHIDHVAKKFGVEHAAIGTDVAYESRNAAAERAKIPKRAEGQRSVPRWEALWPEGSLAGRADPSLAWTNWPLFTVGLLQRGYSDDAIGKILGGNVLRVARAVWENRT